MFALGILAVLQLAALPGLLLTARVRFESATLRALAVFATSLLANYALVLLLAFVGQYGAGTVKGVIACEVLALVWLAWKGKLQREIAPCEVPPLDGRSSAQAFALAITLGAIFVHCWLWSAEWGKVFQAYDAVASWNRWAVAWAQGGMPRDTATYPQLMPIAWSLVYRIVGGVEGELFCRMLMGVFPLLILVGMLVLQERLRKPWLAVGSVAASVLLHLIAEGNRFDGMADVPAAALGFLGVCFLILARESAQKEEGAASLLLAAVCLAAACAAKQAGLMVAVLALIWALTDPRIWAVARASRSTAFWAFVLVVVGAAHWQVVGAVVARLQQDSHLVTYLVHDMHEGRSLWQRLLHGVAQLQHALRPMGMLSPALLACVLSSVGTALGRRVLLHLAVPTFLVWGFAFSYDMRNLAAAIPLAALAAGCGAQALAGWGGALMQKLHAWRAWPRCRPWLAPATVLTVFLAAIQVPDTSFIAGHRTGRRRAGDEDMNRAVAKSMQKDDTTLSAYQLLTIQPGIGKRVVHQPTPLVSDATALAALKGFRWLVVESRLPSADDAVRQRLLSEGRLRETARTASWVLYEITEPKGTAKP
ncbi:MAG: hypothetical protein ACOYMN_10560 [Roseimicrobium sp.]